MILMKNDMLVIYCMAVLRKMMIMAVGFSHSLHDTQTGMNTFSASFQSILPRSINMKW